jgi:hypothetical protein
MSSFLENKSNENVVSITVGGLPTGTIFVQPHPEDVLDVDPVVLARMTARIKGESLQECHDVQDRVSSEFLLRLQIKILQKIFGDATKVTSYYTNAKFIREARIALNSEGFDRSFVEAYCAKRWPGEIFDEVDVFKALLAKTDPVLRAIRMQNAEMRLQDKALVMPNKIELKDLLRQLKPHYLTENFAPMQMTKEILELEPKLRKLLHEGRAAEMLNALLRLFYGGEN